LRPRHLGGSNIGFADGHAAWMSSEAIIVGGDGANGEGNPNAPLEGLNTCGSFSP
jgi:prepilin-type processing-associated H-X9-DG protein